MDNESGPRWAVDVADHLAGCAGCRGWQAAAWQVTRTLRVRPVAATPDPTAKILANYQRVSVVARQRRPDTWRWLLGAVALAQLALGVAELFGVSLIGQMSMAGSEHLSEIRCGATTCTKYGHNIGYSAMPWLSQVGPNEDRETSPSTRSQWFRHCDVLRPIGAGDDLSSGGRGR